MLVIYSYVPETNHVSRIHSVAVMVYLQFIIYAMSPMLSVLCLYISILRQCSDKYGCFL